MLTITTVGMRPTPNTTFDGDGFYVSYNDVDVGAYGADTTALVRGQMEQFLILNGDHRSAYRRLVPMGWSACLDYFLANQDRVNKRSDLIPAEVNQPSDAPGDAVAPEQDGFGR